MNLVEDIRNRQDDYAAQLSSLTLAAMSQTREKGEESERSIISSLLAPGVREAEAAQQAKEEKLWQARLVLAIGEILDIEDEEIARNLAILEDEQADLFKSLHGDGEAPEEESPFDELSQLESNLFASHSGNMKSRVNSWKSLYLETDFEEDDLFFTPSQAAGDIVVELYEKKSGSPAEHFPGLELPGLIAWTGDEALAAVEQFIDDNRELLDRLHSLLRDLVLVADTAVQDSQPAGGFAEAAKEWRQQLETVFPVKQFGRVPVDLYLFPSLSCKSLITGTGKKETNSNNGLLMVAG